MTEASARETLENLAPDNLNWYSEYTENREKKSRIKKIIIAAVLVVLLLVIPAIALYESIIFDKQVAYEESYHRTEDGIVFPFRAFSLRPDAKHQIYLPGQGTYFCYGGGRYHYTTEFSTADAVPETLLGEYLGTTTGGIWTWVPQDGYPDFASNFLGDVYTINGVSPEYLLGVFVDQRFVYLYIANGALTVQKGADIFERFLHLDNTVKTVTIYNWGQDTVEAEFSGNDPRAKTLFEEMYRADFLMDSETEASKTSCRIVMKTEYGLKYVFTLSDDGYLHYGQVCVPVSLTLD